MQLELREYDVKDVCSDEERHSGSNDKEIAEEKKEPPSSKQSSSSSLKKGHSRTDDDEDCEMRGVHAKVDIPPNQICVSIPRKCLITVEMGQATEIGQAILNSDLELDAPKHVFLMIFLLWDRKGNGKNSFFKPYYDILPKTLSNMPIFWSEEELAYLEGSYLLAQIDDRNEAIEDDYHTICNVAPQLADIATLDEFKWARMCVCSRNFGLQIDGNRTSALVPHADMLNHYRPRETKWTFDDYRQAFTITSLQTIPSGSQVYDSYGQKCNHRFLLNYGFAVEDNREVDGFCPNEVPVELGIMPDDVLFDAKHDFWTRGENTSNSFGNTMMHLGGISHFDTFTNSNLAAMRNNSMSSMSTNTAPSIKRIRVCVSNNENTRILFSMLRVIVADESELRIITSSASSLVATSPHLSRAMLGLSGTSGLYRTCRDIRCPISLRNERASMQHLLGVTGRALRMYPTTLSQDIVDLLDERPFPRFSNKRHAKIQISGEKEVLHHFAEWARTALEVMDIIECELFDAPWNKLDSSKRQCLDFNSLIQSMEDDSENETTKHHTIVRYCADVLGALRREEKKRLMRNNNTVLQNMERNNMPIGRGSLNPKGNTKG